MPEKILTIIDSINNLGIYIHYPFCVRECFYCDFYKRTSFDSRFYEDLLSEVLIFKQELLNLEYDFKLIDTIYFGGGTPSLMSVKFVEKLLDLIYQNFRVCKEVEINFEINPDISVGYLRDLKSLGINRISIGVQSFNLFGLRIMGRTHSPEQIFTTIKNVEKFFDNYNIDMLCLYPYQDIDSLREDLNIVISISPPHVSYYLMDVDKRILYPNILLKKIYQLYEVSDDFYQVIQECLSVCYDHYEVSNFAQSQLYCRHNLKYWYYCDYIGFGPSAVSKLTIGNKVLRTIKINQREWEYIDSLTQIREKIFLALRTKWGIVINGTLVKLDDFRNYYTKTLDILKAYGIE
ncbi:MAG: radical SAM family heme chaperone HemW [Candidatus Calescibacterium sp.]|nr:radical SAM family heme chaperone HemW [Candidatus Calescibacterium sp.]MCX7972569.1 radical SAM family heme chaperone HemW [bacterium]MDW8195796.1 radical SAM family heme chaperone HemW [Candidatus Calescibacterium sp.]